MTEAEMVETVARAESPWAWDMSLGYSTAVMELAQKQVRERVRYGLTALGLIGSSPTHWLAPWEASEGMVEASWGCRFKLEDDAGGRVYAAMRDAHLGKEQP